MTRIGRIFPDTLSSFIRVDPRAKRPRNPRSDLDGVEQSRFGSNDDPHRKPVPLPAHVLFNSARVGDSPFGIVDKADQRSAIGVLLIFLNIDTQLLPQLPRPKAAPGLFCLDNDLLQREKEIRSRTSARIIRRPHFSPDIVMLQSQQGMKQILNVVFILHAESFSIVAPRSQLPCDEVKPGAQTLQRQHLAYACMQGAFGLRCFA